MEGDRIMARSTHSSEYPVTPKHNFEGWNVLSRAVFATLATFASFLAEARSGCGCSAQDGVIYKSYESGNSTGQS